MLRPILLLLFLLTLLAPARAAEPPLNFLVILIDDMGLTDVGCFGSRYYETPNIDKLANDGMRFTQAYSACTVCSPTRAALMTGLTPARLHVTDWIAGHERPKAKLRIPAWTKELPTETTTLAEILHERGYTTAHFGKWHLERSAKAHGFDFTLADNGKGQPAAYLPPYKNPNLTDGPPGEELTGRLTQETCRWMEDHKDKPWMIYLAHYAVHTPVGGKPDVIAKYREKAKAMTPQGVPAYAAMVQAVDDSVGALVAKLKELGLTERTVVLFTSDNGGLELGKPPVTDNLGVRAGKGSAYEGGVRVPAIVRWPGLTKPATTCSTPVITMDWFATMAAAAGAETKCDGVDVRPLLRAESIAPRPLYWHYPHYHPGGATPYSAIRSGDFRLVHFYEDDRAELYDLAHDPEEKDNLAPQQPDRVKELQDQLNAWLKESGAQMPTANPDYQPRAR